MDTIKASGEELKSDFSSQISKLQQDVTATQESSSQEVVKKLNKRAYQFQKKGNEAQFIFNSSVEDHISAAKKELKKLDPTGEQDKTTLKNATTHLDEGIKAIEVRQKHIRIADRSEMGWAVTGDCIRERRTRRTRKESTERRGRRKGYPKGNVWVQTMHTGRR